MRYLKTYNESKTIKYIPIDLVDEAIDISLDLEDEGIDYSLQFYVNALYSEQWRNYDFICDLPDKDEVMKTVKSIGINIKSYTLNKDKVVIGKSIKRFVDFAKESGLTYNIHLSPSLATTTGRKEYRDVEQVNINDSAKIEICIFPK